MKSDKYFDWARNTPLRIQDGVHYKNWGETASTAAFAQLEDRIYIFPDQAVIDSLDKYRLGVFELELDTDSGFHKGRVETTLLLLEQFRQH